jgi:hypothetical protein
VVIPKAAVCHIVVVGVVRSYHYFLHHADWLPCSRCFPSLFVGPVVAWQTTGREVDAGVGCFSWVVSRFVIRAGGERGLTWPLSWLLMLRVLQLQD